MLSRAKVIRKNKAVSLYCCSFSLVPFITGKYTFFPLLGLLNSFHEKEGPAAEIEAKFRLEVFSC